MKMERSVGRHVRSLQKKNRGRLRNVTSAPRILYCVVGDPWFAESVSSVSYKDVLFLQRIDDPTTVAPAPPYLRCIHLFKLPKAQHSLGFPTCASMVEVNLAFVQLLKTPRDMAAEVDFDIESSWESCSASMH
jgi:hypothetical protein